MRKGTPDLGRTQRGPKKSRGGLGLNRKCHRWAQEVHTCKLSFSWRLMLLPTENNLSARKQVLPSYNSDSNLSSSKLWPRQKTSKEVRVLTRVKRGGKVAPSSRGAGGGPREMLGKSPGRPDPRALLPRPSLERNGVGTEEPHPRGAGSAPRSRPPSR